MSKGNRHKQQGTAEELRQRRLLEAHDFHVERLAEGGANDLGDLRVTIGSWDLIIESKDKAALNIHETVAKAVNKAVVTLSPAAVWWKRKARKEGNQKRTQVGRPIVCMQEDQFIELLELARKGIEHG